ncbi:MAG: ribosome-associated translation inhibitor RaiA [Chloroflexi bacterium]|nr:ribosome-associated translation inhibitor RaiA [Chloroflexota bacterium]
MRTVIHGRNYNVSERVREHIEKKVDRLERYLPGIRELQVELSETNAKRSGQRMVVQMTVFHERGQILRAEERSDDMYASLDAVVDKIQRQIERYKGKRRRRGQDGFSGAETAVVLPDEDFEDRQILRRKAFSTLPMLEEEAIEQMELLGHDFFVFVNADTNRTNVIYTRHDGNYGLLEPEDLHE